MKYSIIIPHYNRPDLIIKTIESFKDLKDKEILIIDDVSTEENLEKLRTAINKMSDQNIILYESEGGVKYYLSGARNKGLDLAKGEWIYFIDDDDRATPKFVKWLNEAKLNENIIYRFPYITETNKSTTKVFMWLKKNFFYSVQVSTFLINKKIFNKYNLRFFDKTFGYHEDTCFANDIFSFGIKMKYVTRMFAIFYNRSNISMTRGKADSIEKYIISLWNLNSNAKYFKTFGIIMLYHYETRILKQDFIKDLESKKIFIETFDKLNIKFKDIWRLDWFRLFYWPTFKRNIKKWRKEIEANK